MSTFYITTPIYYVNAEPHLGHAYTTAAADAAARFHRLMGDETRFQTGSDEHGDKIAAAAAAEGIEPQAYADRISGKFRDAWPKLNIAPDNFIRTTDAKHKQTVRQILARVHEAGDIYFAKYGGNYCVGCERFLTDHEMVDGKCPDHKTKPERREEENYFFRMSKYQDRLKRHIQENPDFIRPERYRNEILAMLKDPLDDLCISRPKTRLTWGIELPFDDRFVTYVWFDALINYISGLDWPDGELQQKFWPHAQHLIAKDILKPHAIFWPTMLMAAGVDLYQHLNVHGYWNVGAGKMSKSLGNAASPLELAEVYGADAFRYFLMREMHFGLDAAFSEELLVERYNADLANDLGNLFSRVMNMLHQYRDGVIPQPGEMLAPDQAIWSQIEQVKRQYQREMEKFAFHQALFHVWELMGEANKYVVKQAPWVLAKDPAQAGRLDTVLYTLCLVLAETARRIWPVMPAAAEKMWESLGLREPIAPEPRGERPAIEFLVPGTQAAKPQALFPRVDTKKVKAKAQKAEKKAQAKKTAPAKKKAKPAGPAPEITIDEFARVELKLGKVLEAEPIKGADRLLKLSIDLGEESPRQVVAGIAQHYRPEELAGRQVVVAANLKPAKLMGVESRGMVLACVGDDKVRLLSPDMDMPPGSKVR